MKNRIGLALLLTVLWAACSNKDKSSETATAQSKEIAHVSLSQEQQKLLGIVLGQPILRSMNGTLKANGMLDVPPQNMVTVSAPLGGFVKSTELLQGMKVKKGQTVIVLQHPDYIQLQEDYLTSKNQLEFLELEYKRQQELSKENVTAAKALQQAKSNYFGAKAKVQGLKAKLKLININPQELENGEIQNTISIPSPITGFVTEVNVNIGKHINPTDVLFKIIDTEHLHAEAQVFEKDVPHLKIGQLVRIYLANENKERLAKVFLIGKEITPERTVRVHCHLEGEDPSLIPGLYFKALIETDPQQVTTLPTEALVDFDNKHYVFVEQKAGALDYEMIEISKIKSEEDFAEVVLPSSIAGRKIVLKGTYSLLSILKNTEE
ncbi:MAG: efflux RND transporter periplasmic adaptor subunit [Cytophagales bacterium]|nr:efflux RND transporter periplasmic adaptor subunit [Cytophagales bacterium]MCA6386396.1 efflux RND transporter periplasmic adaptor subunit [Cytophagales bacterium]MCA6390433.1 efflux RND transporter periplasmic adaptor subunit [Cytophagales bacterium]MCA6395011.1 efflux RND transporter periplasmic adaptor subunit [Cytophagales bacterium]MCA6397921.1 efflux RND transporter periplasmic adaptor subunit [Cytophagales bacterium]